MIIVEDDIIRFFTHVDMSPGLGKGDCWFWKAGKTSDGYGKFKLDRVKERAHRVSWEINVNRIPDGMSVLHSCDFRLCVNFNHLFLGSQIDNIKDMVSKGRNSWRNRDNS